MIYSVLAEGLFPLDDLNQIGVRLFAGDGRRCRLDQIGQAEEFDLLGGQLADGVLLGLGEFDFLLGGDESIGVRENGQRLDLEPTTDAIGLGLRRQLAGVAIEGSDDGTGDLEPLADLAAADGDERGNGCGIHCQTLFLLRQSV